MTNNEKKILLTNLENLLTADSMGFKKLEIINHMGSLLNQIGLYMEAQQIVGKMFFRKIDDNEFKIKGFNYTQSLEKLYIELFEIIYKNTKTVITLDLLFDNSTIDDMVNYEITQVEYKKRINEIMDILENYCNYEG